MRLPTIIRKKNFLPVYAMYLFSNILFLFYKNAVDKIVEKLYNHVMKNVKISSP